MRRLQPDEACGWVGPVQQDVEQTADGFVTVEAERASLPPLCDRCNYARSGGTRPARASGARGSATRTPGAAQPPPVRG